MCYCGNTLRYQPLALTLCNKPCAGNSSQNCGDSTGIYLSVSKLGKFLLFFLIYSQVKLLTLLVYWILFLENRIFVIYYLRPRESHLTDYSLKYEIFFWRSEKFWFFCQRSKQSSASCLLTTATTGRLETVGDVAGWRQESFDFLASSY